MSNLEAEFIGFFIVAVVVVALAYFTKKKEDQYNKMFEDKED